MDAKAFQRLLAEEVSTFKAYLETDDHDWIVKGFIDVNKNVYTITNDTKVVSKIIEILLIPRLDFFARQHDMLLELPSRQNYYPDMTFIDADGHKYAVDFKTSYYKDNGKINGLTLGSYWGYFRHRSEKDNIDYPYEDYESHLVIGMLYKQAVEYVNEKGVYSVEELADIKAVVDNFIFFVQPKWRIASDFPGSGNTRNIGGITEISRLIEGTGPFTQFGEKGEMVFDDYWMNYYNQSDARQAGLERPHYKNLATYKEYLEKQKEKLEIIERLDDNVNTAH